VVEKLLFIGELEADGRLTGKMDHLVCFYPGLLALGHAAGVRPRADQVAEQMSALEKLGFGADATQLDVAIDLTAGCREMYARNPLGMGPEIAHYNVADEHAVDDVLIKPADAHSLLRPEYVESLYVLWRVTGAQKYRDWGWDVWRGIESHARVETGGYASVDSVLEQAPVLRDHMESFFVAETLKYLFLLFADSDALDLEAWVLNTEAHPLRVVPPAARAAPGAPAAASLLQGLAPESLVPGAPLPRGLRDGGAATPEAAGFAHDLPPGEQEEAWVAEAWRKVLSKTS
jgi:mannosyl-oligosaccharide alpha-1,2-mannosidase